MSILLLTVDGVEQRGDDLQLSPRVPVRQLASTNPDVMMPRAGDVVRLRTPDGRELSAFVVMFGVEAWARDGYIYTDSDPQNPLLTLTITGQLGPADVPVGTEVWQHEPRRSEG